MHERWLKTESPETVFLIDDFTKGGSVNLTVGVKFEGTTIPVVGSEVSATIKGGQPIKQTSDVKGEVVFKGLTPGLYTVSALFDAKTVTLPEKELKLPEERLGIVFAPILLTATTKNARGAPYPGAKITAKQGAEVTGAGTTDKTGSSKLTLTKPGKTQVYAVDKSGSQIYVKEIDV
jgi:hypothetical protein